MKQGGMLAVDMGASNGRIVWGRWTDGGLEMREVHRFDNVPIRVDGLMRWDMDALLGGIREGICRCAGAGLPFDTLGLCSWGNTIGVLDAQGELLFPPIHYREPATDAALDGLYSDMPRREMFRRTLFIPMTIQPTVVLRYLRERAPELLSEAQSVLMISDLFNQRLCGRAAAERTMAATSGMVDMRTGDWNREYMAELGIRPEWFPDLIPGGMPLAPLRDEFIEGLNLRLAPEVLAVAGHDTASAASVVPMDDPARSLYLSCGTWSCMGCRVERPIADEGLYEAGATNDMGAFGEHQLRFNHTGLWILQECRRQWRSEGLDIGHADLVRLARDAQPFLAAIDTEDALFFRPDDMPRKVQAYCRNSGQRVPEGPGEIARVILESLALRYRYSAEVLSRASHTRFREMRIFGGGSRNALLCQLSADALGMSVVAGPFEASVIGNFMQQGLSTGALESRERAMELIARTEALRTFLPEGDRAWDDAYCRALRIFQWKLP